MNRGTTTITFTTANGLEVTATPEEWLGAIMVSLPHDLRGKVMENVIRGTGGVAGQGGLVVVKRGIAPKPM